MSEVDATGMEELYPGVCSEGIMYPHAHFPETGVTYWRGYYSVSFNSKGYPRTSTSERAEVDTRVFLLCRYVPLI